MTMTATSSSSTEQATEPPARYPNLFTPLQLGDLTLPNRVILAPLTRCRADLNSNVPNDLMALYYSQRASAGLLITEYTTIKENAITFHTEGAIFNQVQVEGWKKTTEAVHAKGGLIFCQLAHGGRAAHPLNNNDQLPVAPSPIALTNKSFPQFTRFGEERFEYPAPRELSDEEVQEIVQDFKIAAQNAKDAGFDGIEIHAANGYLINQFLCESSNQRTHGLYSGESYETRFQFLKEILEHVIEVWGKDRVGVRISPINSYQGMIHENPVEFTADVATRLNEFDIAYLHLVRGDIFGIQNGDVVTPARENFMNTLIANLGYTPEEAEQSVEEKTVDAVAFGRLFIANPDLPERLKVGAKLNELDGTTLYTKEAKGYTDYPFLSEEEETKE